MLDVRDGHVGLGRAQAIAGAFELGARFLRQTPRTLRGTLRVLDPRKQKQALPAAERLPERGEIALAALNRAARFFVAAQQILNLAGYSLALGLAQSIVLFDEHL